MYVLRIFEAINRTPLQPIYTPEQKRARSVAARVAEILHLAEALDFSATMILHDMETLDCNIAAKRENECIARLYQSYPGLSDEEWVCHFELLVILPLRPFRRSPSSRSFACCHPQTATLC